jgi:predicted DNA-binding transcriptional regulator AlpA
MRTDLKSAANGRIQNPPDPSVTVCHAATSGNADLLDVVAATGRYSTSPTTSSSSPPSSELLNRRAVCAYFGGINASTLYRGIRQGRFPRPIRVGGSSRWLASECEAVLRGMMEARR